MFCYGHICSLIWGCFQYYFIYVLFIIVWKLYLCLRNHVASKIWKTDLKVKFGEWAVVTGCTDGIGKAYCHELAKRGINLILVSRTKTKLKAVSSELEKLYGVETEIIQADFTKEKEIYEDLGKKLKDRNIGMLVNNVGVIVDEPKSFEYMTHEDIWGHLAVNMGAPTYMTKIILPAMIKNKRGAIINLSSVAAMNPFPYFGIYAATKAYNYFFSEALRSELHDHGIYLQTVTPFYVATSMTKYAEELSKPSLLVPTAETFAASAISTIGYADVSCGYYAHELVAAVYYIFPQWIIVKLIAQLQKKWMAKIKKKD